MGIFLIRCPSPEYWHCSLRNILHCVLYECSMEVGVSILSDSPGYIIHCGGRSFHLRRSGITRRDYCPGKLDVNVREVQDPLLCILYATLRHLMDMYCIDQSLWMLNQFDFLVFHFDRYLSPLHLSLSQELVVTALILFSVTLVM